MAAKCDREGSRGRERERGRARWPGNGYMLALSSRVVILCSIFSFFFLASPVSASPALPAMSFCMRVCVCACWCYPCHLNWTLSPVLSSFRRCCCFWRGICVRWPLYNLAEKQLMDNAMSSPDGACNNNRAKEQEESTRGWWERAEMHTIDNSHRVCLTE